MFRRLYRFFSSVSVRNKVLLGMLLVSLPPLLGAITYSIYTARGLIYEFTLRDQQHHVHTLAFDVKRFLSGVREDVLFLSQSEEVTELLEAKADGDMAAYEQARQTLEREFLTFARVKGIYYQVRYLDNKGMEIVRVDSDGRKAFVVPRDQLQDKSNRYYFADTIVLPKGELMVSPLDLNVEHGEIERPFKPVIRYATPVWFEGQPAGIVIVNVFAARFLDELGAQRIPSEIVALIDQDGYYLYHSADESKRWGRDLGTGITLAEDYPQIMPYIFSRVHEAYEHESKRIGNEFLTYTSFSPPGTTAYNWTLVSIRPRRVVLAPLFQFEWVVTGILIVTLLAVGALGSWSSASLVRPIQQLETMAVNMERGDLDTVISVPVSDEIGTLAEAFDRARVALRQTYRELENQVATAERRAVQLHTAAQVSSAAVAILEPRELLSRVAMLVSEEFGFYHTGIFLIDEADEWAVLQAASSPGGQHMLARGHQLRVGEQGIVGYVAAAGEPRIALDVGEDAVFFDNPDLPHTHSEMALPLQARGRVIGVLDVQSIEEAAFTDEDVIVLQTLADQVAMALSNAHLFQQSQQRLESLQRAYGEYSYEAWSKTARAQAGLGYRYSRRAVSPAKDFWRPEMSLALQKGQTIHDTARPDTAAIPIRVRGQVIGVMDARKPEGAGEWTTEEIALLETLAEQLGAALESARLYQDTQRRAAREQLIGELTARMRESLDMEVVLQTAIREIGESLGIAEVEVRMGSGVTTIE